MEQLASNLSQSYDPGRSPLYEQETFKKFQLYAQHRALRLQFQQLDLKKIEDVILDELVYELRAWFWSRENCHELITPANWWEMLKRDHAPQWFLKRWPVQNRISYVMRTVIYPEITVPVLGNSFNRMKYAAK